MSTTKIDLFQDTEIRKTTHGEEWWFVLEDIVSALAVTSDPKDYLSKMRRRDPELKKGWGQIVLPLQFVTK